MYLCRPTYKILSEYASLSLSLFHIFHFYFFHIFQLHFFILFFMYTSFYFHLCRPTYTTLKEFASFSHLHSENFCILTQIWKFSNLGETLSRFLALGFLRIKSCIAGIFNLIILTTNLSKRIIITLSCTVSDEFMCA